MKTNKLKYKMKTNKLKYKMKITLLGVLALGGAVLAQDPIVPPKDPNAVVNPPGVITPNDPKPIGTAQQTTLDAHIARVDNPHAVTASQVGAASLADLNNAKKLFSVVRYGAVGGDALDDRVAINSAIVAANAAGGGTVFFPDGVYYVSKDPASAKQAISLLSNVAIRGESREGVIIKLLDDVLHDTPVMSADVGGVAENISITNLTIDGNKSRPATAGGGTGSEDEGINIKDGKNILIHNVRVRDCAMDGIDLDAGTKITLSNLYIDNNDGTGLHAAGSGVIYMLLTNSQFYDNGNARINISDPAVSNSAANIDLKVASYINVSNVISKGGPRPLSVIGGTRVQISNSIFLGDPGYPAVDLRGLPLSLTGEVVFSNCRIVGGTDSAAQGVEINDGFDVAEFSGCFIRGYIGLDVVDGGDLKIRGCKMDAVNHHIRLLEANDGEVYVGGHTVFTASTFGNDIRVEDDCKGVVDGVRMLKVGGTGIFLRPESDDQWIIRNVTCSTSREVVRIDSGSTGEHIMQYIHAPNGSIAIVGSGNNVLKNSNISTLKFNFSGATLNNEICGNKIDIVTPGSSIMSSQKWGDNDSLPVGYRTSGTATLVAGTVTVSSDIIPAGAKIALTRLSAGGTTGHLSVGAIVAGTSFAIDSSEVGDASSVFWKIEN